MRTIKFRAWDKKEKKMIKLSGIIFPEAPAFKGCVIDDDCNEYPYKNRFILMQFTGLLDKNDEEIYEGDIVKVTSKKNTLNGRRPKSYKFLLQMRGRSIVIFKEGMFMIKKKSKRGQRKPLTGLTIKFLGLEIIGNIHENPELLQGQDK